MSFHSSTDKISIRTSSGRSTSFANKTFRDRDYNMRQNELPDNKIPSQTHNIESIGYEVNTGLQPCKPKSSHCPQDDTGEHNDKETATCGHETKLCEASRQFEIKYNEHTYIAVKYLDNRQRCYLQIINIIT